MSDTVLISSAINSFFGHKKFDQFASTLSNVTPKLRRAYLNDSISKVRQLLDELSYQIKTMDSKVHDKYIGPLLSVKHRSTKGKGKTIKSKRHSGGSFGNCFKSELERLRNSPAYQETLSGLRDARNKGEKDREAYYHSVLVKYDLMHEEQARMLCSREGAVISFVKKSFSHASVGAISGASAYVVYLLADIPKNAIVEVTGMMGGVAGSLIDYTTSSWGFIKSLVTDVGVIKSEETYSALASSSTSSFFSSFIGKVGHDNLKLAISITMFLLMFIFLEGLLMVARQVDRGGLTIQSPLFKLETKPGNQSVRMADTDIAKLLQNQSMLLTNASVQRNVTRRALIKNKNNK
jgi:hypothetical protein